MMSENTRIRAERAVTLKHSGHNCCQAVLLAYADRLPLSEAVLDDLGLPFGSGMGTGEGTCGALCGAQMAAGLLGLGTARRAIFRQFVDDTGASVCRDLKGTAAGRPLCSCDDCVRCGVTALAAVLNDAEDAPQVFD
ncbi:C-GCAxxG-C-C family protein [Pseudoramibacter faecis]|uniref:C-GCAxxG-C-C family protein n=1 Tax=Pseudoramibacter faecis TaxID=3108534 RepID=UPI002E780D86|nr:C-GCAxxG-C-C family protein [Pseudoramibacter sp. HA2172]